MAQFFVEECPWSLMERDGRGRLPLHAAIQSYDAASEKAHYLANECPQALLERDNDGLAPFQVAAAAAAGGWAPFELVYVLLRMCPQVVRL
jgi:hypothetical protein